MHSSLFIFLVLFLFLFQLQNNGIHAFIPEGIDTNIGSWDSNACPLPYHYESDLSDGIFGWGGSVGATQKTYGYGILDLVNGLDLNSITRFMDPVTETFISYSQAKINAAAMGLHVTWPDLNLPWQATPSSTHAGHIHLTNPLAVITGSATATAFSMSSFNRMGGTSTPGGPALVWVPLLHQHYAGDQIDGSTDIDHCTYLAYVDNVVDPYYYDEAAFDIFTQSGEGIFTSTWDRIYNVYPSTSADDSYFDPRPGFVQGLRHLRKNAVLIFTWEGGPGGCGCSLPSTQYAIDTLAYPTIFCLNDWHGHACELPATLAPKSASHTGSSTASFCSNTVPSVPSASSITMNCAGLNSGHSCEIPWDMPRHPCACLYNNQDTAFTGGIAPYIYSSASNEPYSISNCSNLQVRGTVEMEAVSYGSATHWCQKTIHNGIVTDVSAPAEGTRGTPCRVTSSAPCRCSDRFGGANCEFDKATYCGYNNTPYVAGSEPSVFIPNPSDKISGVITESPPLAGQTNYPFTSCDGISGTTFGIPASVFNYGSTFTTGCTVHGGGIFTTSILFGISVQTSPIFTITWGYQNPGGFSSGLTTISPNLCRLNNYSFCAVYPSNGTCLWNPTNNPSTVTSLTIGNAGCYTCPTGRFGRDCLTTCSPFSCFPKASCQNLGGTGWALAPTGTLNVKCVCDTDYTNALPGQPLTECTSCVNEFSVLVPTCNNNGFCPLIFWSGPPFALHCQCNNLLLPAGQSYVDLGCSITSKQTYTCGSSNSIVFTCSYVGLGVLSDIDFRYDCSASGTLSENVAGVGAQTKSYNFLAKNVQLIQNADDPATADSVGGGHLQLFTTAMACPSIYNKISADVGNPSQICPFPFYQFPGIGQSSSSSFFCDVPVANQWLKAIVNNVPALCYVYSQVTSPSSLYQGTSIYRCQQRQQDSSVFEFSCDILIDRGDYVLTNGTLALGQTLVKTCFS